jgi:single-stranded-DNA-specific exonuclease
MNRPQTDPEIVRLLAQALECHPVLAMLLAERGICDPDQARFFLNPDFSRLTDPFLLKDMDKAVARIHTAVVNHEKILVFGDFDSDGVTATALLIDFLEHCDADVSWYIPHRSKEGYSLQKNHIKMAVQMDIDLIITVDCGIAADKPVQDALNEDIDVIVTDHHEPGDRLPDAAAVIDPKRHDCICGLDYLAGVGVAFYLVMALRKFFRTKNFWKDIEEPCLVNYLDLFAVGTIGDMVPLIHDNRVLCMAGIEKLRKGSRPGFNALARACRLDPEKIDSDDISFKIVPRINAAGRISHARICVSQLTAKDIASAENTAVILDQLNLKRRTIEKQIMEDIEKRLAENKTLTSKKLLFLWDENWNPSVLGIVASKLARKYCIPVVLLNVQGDTATGSSRSIASINIHQALSHHACMLEQFGGHAMAAGLKLKTVHLQALNKALEEYMENTYSPEDYEKPRKIDAVLKFNDISFSLAHQINRLRPFGTDNPEPVFACKNVRVKSSFIIGSCHRKMILESQESNSGHSVEAFEFNVDTTHDMPDFYPEIIFRLKLNKFRPDSAQIIFEPA